MTSGPDPSGPDRSGNESDNKRARLAVAVVGTLLGTLAGALVVRELVVEWGAASEAIADASVQWLVLAAAMAMAAMVAMAGVWADVLAALGAPRPRGKVVRWYFLGELGKYLPGGVWTVVGRGELARRGGVPAAPAYASVGLSLVALYVAAALVAAVLVPFDLVGAADDPRVVLGVVVVIVAGAGVLHPGTWRLMLGVGRRLTGRALTIDPPAGRTMAALVLRYVPAWIGVGLTTWAVARALDPDASITRVMLAAIVSWIAGFLAVPVPAGGGVREAVFLAVAGLPVGVGAATAIAARLLFVAVDALGALVASLTAGRRILVPTGGDD